MAINYTKIGWDTTKYVNPTNMNQMDNGIKAACDGVDEIKANYVKASDSATQKIAVSSGSGGTVLQVQGRATATWIQYLNSSGTSLGYIGVESNNKPAFYDSSSHEIALAENVVKLSSSAVQEIATTGTSAFPISVKGGYTGETLVRYKDGSGNTLGYIGVASGDKPVFYGSSGSGTKEIALKAWETISVNDYTSFNDVYNAIKDNPNLRAAADIGNTSSVNIKNILPNPTGFGNYTLAFISWIGDYMMQVTARGQYHTAFAVCYVYTDDRNWFRTQWEIKTNA